MFRKGIVTRPAIQLGEAVGGLRPSNGLRGVVLQGDDDLAVVGVYQIIFAVLQLQG